MSMQILTMASNSKCFHVKIFVDYLQRFSLLIRDSLEIQTDSRSIYSHLRTIFAWLHQVFPTLQRFQEYQTETELGSDVLISADLLSRSKSYYVELRHSNLLTARSSFNNLMMILSNHPGSTMAQDRRGDNNWTVRQKKPFRSRALIDRKKSVFSLLHNSWTILGQFLDNGGKLKLRR